MTCKHFLHTHHPQLATDAATDTVTSHTFLQPGAGSQNVIRCRFRDDLSMAECFQGTQQAVHAGDGGEAYAEVIAVAALLHRLHDPGQKQTNSAKSVTAWGGSQGQKCILATNLTA